MRSYAWAGLENVALWHERDISHSSVERIIFPDSFIMADYAVHRMAILLDGLDVHKRQMLDNIARSQGQLFSSQVLLALLEKGLDRELSYYHVQRICHSLGKGEHLQDKILADAELKQILKPREVRDIFSGARNVKTIRQVVKRLL